MNTYTSSDAPLLELEDIQGIILRGYEELKHASFALLSVTDVAKVRPWMRKLPIADARKPNPRSSNVTIVQIAFTYHGLRCLIDPYTLDAEPNSEPPAPQGFSMPFIEGMVTAHRSRILGDLEENDPSNWEWQATWTTLPSTGAEAGSAPLAPESVISEPKTATPDPTAGVPATAEATVPPSQQSESSPLPTSKLPVHILLMLYASSEELLRKAEDDYVHSYAENGLSLVTLLGTKALEGRKEHFGFRDGIGQPNVVGKTGFSESDVEASFEANQIAPGEFLLGYLNEYAETLECPTIDPKADLNYMLPASLSKRPDFGRNGSYLVFRTLAQNVQAFWNYSREKTVTQAGEDDPGAMIKLASQMVGRWPSGAPLVKEPSSDPFLAIIPGTATSASAHPDSHDDKDGAFHRSQNGAAISNDNNFTYAHPDPYGERVPYGAHIRRANPRDSLVMDRDQSIKISKHHRMIRRGRAYGDEVDKQLDPVKMLSGDDTGKRGLHFICFVSDIERQFEFVQQMWLNSPKVHGLRDDVPPVFGERDPGAMDKTGVFTLPDKQLSQRLSGLSRFVTVKGGAYFFMPGIRAMRYLANDVGVVEKQPANAVFKGGGTKAIALAGALDVASKYGSPWKGIAGTSGGAIVAALLAAGYTSDQIYGFMSGLGVEDAGKTVLQKFEPRVIAKRRALLGVPVVSEVLNLLSHFGAYNADSLQEMLDTLLKHKHLDTFRHFRCSPDEEAALGTPYRLQLMATDLTNRKAVILPQDLAQYGIDPDSFPIAKAVRMSMSIPFVFEPVIVKNKRTRVHFIDGGLVSDYPIWLFDTHHGAPWPTFGFFLDEGEPTPHRVRGVLGWLSAYLRTGWSSLDTILARRFVDSRTVKIDVSGFKTVNRNISEDEMRALRKRGQEAAERFFRNFRAAEYRSLTGAGLGYGGVTQPSFEPAQPNDIAGGH